MAKLRLLLRCSSRQILRGCLIGKAMFRLAILALWNELRGDQSLYLVIMWLFIVVQVYNEGRRRTVLPIL